MDDIEKRKQDLRKKYIEIRNNITNKANKSKMITKYLIEDKEFNKAQTIALYKNLETEVDTNELINYSINSGKTIVLPRVVDNTLQFYKIKSINDKFIKSKFGVQEPENNEENKIEKYNIDLVVVPGLCFDKNRNRLGFGKGYYDNILRDTKLKNIAICFEEQLLKEGTLPITDRDVRVQKIITEKAIYK